MKRAYYFVSLYLCCATLIVTFPIVRCEPIKYYHGDMRSMVSDDKAVMNAEMDSATEIDVMNRLVANNEREADDDKAMNTAYPPVGGGLFRDPTDVLGAKFTPLVMINLCEVLLTAHANVISDIKFTTQGNKTCSDACIQYHGNINVNGPASVTLVENYCDYTGSSSFDDSGQGDLTTTCTCTYKTRCNQRTAVVMYVFEANCSGFVKVAVTDMKKSTYIT